MFSQYFSNIYTTEQTVDTTRRNKLNKHKHTDINTSTHTTANKTMTKHTSTIHKSTFIQTTTHTIETTQNKHIRLNMSHTNTTINTLTDSTTKTKRTKHIK